MTEITEERKEKERKGEGEEEEEEEKKEEKRASKYHPTKAICLSVTGGRPSFRFKAENFR